ncbi:ISAs1 family transposase, partial [Escherichia coli]
MLITCKTSRFASLCLRHTVIFPCVISAFSTMHSLVIGQIKTDEKSNEITAIPELLNMLDIKGKIITTDAMGCQKDIAEKIQKQGGDYVFAVKG